LPFPAAAASLFGATSFATTRIRGTACCPQPGDPQWQGWTRPPPSQCLATTVGSCARLLPVVREVSEGSRRPSAVSGMPLPPPNRRHGVPCLARCISPVAAVFSRPGTSDAAIRARGRVSPTDAGLLQARPASRTTGFPRFTAVALRSTPNCFDAPRTPWTSGWPRRGRQRTAPKRRALYRHHQRVTS